MPVVRKIKIITDGQFSEAEAEARFEAALKGALKTPHKPHKISPQVGANQPPKDGNDKPPRKIKGV